MAYQGGGLLQIWNPDVSTRAGAESAMDSAKFGFLIIAAFRIVVYGVAASTSGLAFDEVAPSGLPVSIVAGILLLDIVVPLLAAWRLHVYKGAFMVPVATVLYVLGIALAPAIGSIVIGIIFTGVFVAGIRGAWALRRGTGFEDDHYATFS
jgi:hypothetical protein